MRCTRYALECKRGCTDKCVSENAYHPSNGTEGMSFFEEFCASCIHDNPDPEHPKKCEILTATMLYYPNEPGYPSEWIYDSLGHPKCTSHVHWDWGNDGDPDDDDNPKAPFCPEPPNQLHLFPLYPDEKTFEIIVERQKQIV